MAVHRPSQAELELDSLGPALLQQGRKQQQQRVDPCLPQQLGHCLWDDQTSSQGQALEQTSSNRSDRPRRPPPRLPQFLQQRMQQQRQQEDLIHPSSAPLWSSQHTLCEPPKPLQQQQQQHHQQRQAKAGSAGTGGWQCMPQQQCHLDHSGYHEPCDPQLQAVPACQPTLLPAAAPSASWVGGVISSGADDHIESGYHCCAAIPAVKCYAIRPTSYDQATGVTAASAAAAVDGAEAAGYTAAAAVVDVSHRPPGTSLALAGLMQGQDPWHKGRRQPRVPAFARGAWVVPSALDVEQHKQCSSSRPTQPQCYDGFSSGGNWKDGCTAVGGSCKLVEPWHWEGRHGVAEVLQLHEQEVPCNTTNYTAAAAAAAAGGAKGGAATASGQGGRGAGTEGRGEGAAEARAGAAVLQMTFGETKLLRHSRDQEQLQWEVQQSLEDHHQQEQQHIHLQPSNMNASKHSESEEVNLTTLVQQQEQQWLQPSQPRNLEEQQQQHARMQQQQQQGEQWQHEQHAEQQWDRATVCQPKQQQQQSPLTRQEQPQEKCEGCERQGDKLEGNSQAGAWVVEQQQVHEMRSSYSLSTAGRTNVQPLSSRAYAAAEADGVSLARATHAACDYEQDASPWGCGYSRADLGGQEGKEQQEEQVEHQHQQQQGIKEHHQQQQQRLEHGDDMDRQQQLQQVPSSPLGVDTEVTISRSAQMEDCIVEASLRMASILRTVQQQLEQGASGRSSGPEGHVYVAEGPEEQQTQQQQQQQGRTEEMWAKEKEQQHQHKQQQQEDEEQQKQHESKEALEHGRQHKQQEKKHEQQQKQKQELLQDRQQDAGLQQQPQEHQHELGHHLNQTSSRSSSRMSSASELTQGLVEERICALEEVLQRHLEDKQAAEEAGEVVLQLREALAGALAVAATAATGVNLGSSDDGDWEGQGGDSRGDAGYLGAGNIFGQEGVRGEGGEVAVEVAVLGKEGGEQEEKQQHDNGCEGDGAMGAAAEDLRLRCSDEGDGELRAAAGAVFGAAAVRDRDGYAEGRVEQLAVELRQAEGRHAALVAKQMEHRGEVVKVLEELQLLRLVASQELMCEEQ